MYHSALNLLIVLIVAACILIKLDMYRHLRARSFLWIIAGLTYGLFIRIWLFLSDIHVWSYPDNDWGSAMMVLMYAGLLAGFWGIRQALLSGHKNHR
jgi:hypothetical protein